jgi:ParB family transcriptional regulator, chromosome partitioning protein
MTRKPLGRGLGALIEDSASESLTALDSGVLEAALDSIAPSPFQPRRHFDPERLAELADAIRAQGVIEPLVVRLLPAGFPGVQRYELIAGERRLRAARQAGLAVVPIVVRELDDRAALEMSLVENLAREDLNALEEARAFLRLAREFLLSHEQIAGRIGKSRPYVSNAIRLLELPEEVTGMLERGELTPGQVRPLLALATAAEQIEAARRILAQGISARGAEQLASAGRKQSARNGVAARPDPDVQALVESLQRALKRKVRIVRQRGKSPGRVEIEYYNDDDLTALSDALTSHAPSRFSSLT